MKRDGKARYVKASFLVETAAIFPVIYFVLAASIYMFFYYHDKMILTGTAYETAAVGSEKMRLLNKPDEGELEQYFQERLRGKMIFFAGAIAQIDLSGERISVEAEAYRKHMCLRVKGSMKVTEPEFRLRNAKKLRKAGEAYGGSL